MTGVAGQPARPAVDVPAEARAPGPGPGLEPWWAATCALADRPPAAPRESLWVQVQGRARHIGSLAPALVELLALPQRGEPAWIDPLPGESSAGGWLLRRGDGDGDGDGSVDAGFAALAASLRERGLSGPWRDELLAVEDADGLRVGAIERGVVRPLGITTRAVHLVGWHADGRHWIQQRSARKANDPGKLDTLMGGMISAADTLESALARETWEEAGLRLDQLQGLRSVGRVTLRRPSSQAEGLGYMHEHIDCFAAVLPEGVQPSNQDGEVDAFHLLDTPDLLARLQQDAFTLEAALVLGAALGWPKD